MRILFHSMIFAMLMSSLSFVQLDAQTPSTKAQAAAAATRGKCCCTPGPRGATGPQGPVGVPAFAEFVGIGVVEGTLDAGQSFLIGTPIGQNTVGVTATTNTEGGTSFTFPVGTYVLDYETSLSVGSEGPTGGTIGVYLFEGASPVTGSEAGSSTVGAWLHGRTIIRVTDATQAYVIASNADETTIVTPPGLDAPVVRLTILQLS